MTGFVGEPSPTAPFVTFQNGICTFSGSSGYQKFTMNVTEPSFWYITALFERSSLVFSSIQKSQVQIYNGTFNPANPCDGVFPLFVIPYFYIKPHFTDLLWLTPGSYDVVVTKNDKFVDDGTSHDYFAIHADSSDFHKEVTSNDHWISPSFQGSTCQSDSSASSPYSWYTFSPESTGSYDIFYYTYSPSNPSPVVIATLYEGPVTFLGTGTQDEPADPCTQSWLQTQHSDDPWWIYVGKQFYGFGVFTNKTLVSGVNYTIVLSGYTNESQFHGVWIRPTIINALGTEQNYYPPDLIYGYDKLPCTPKTAPYWWNTHLLIPEYPTMVTDIQELDFDARGCLNVGTSGVKYSVPPNSCEGLVRCSDLGDVTSLAVSGWQIGEEYTLSVTPYFSAASPGKYALYVYSGTQLGPLPAPSETTDVCVFPPNGLFKCFNFSSLYNSPSGACGEHVTYEYNGDCIDSKSQSNNCIYNQEREEICVKATTDHVTDTRYEFSFTAIDSCKKKV